MCVSVPARVEVDPGTWLTGCHLGLIESLLSVSLSQYQMHLKHHKVSGDEEVWVHVKCLPCPDDGLFTPLSHQNNHH